ncbi:hypothetical protein PanWU01x14_302050 [Parasponia andersonii]|uniref:Uncharacterized protein n=1 Tax=Parasponia andersonii TaxID=3476 RepID=A0A2P5ATI7_PARAD|nr:hypothetical protein PanWU01x14_302050 [Parasponia andersonii]
MIRFSIRFFIAKVFVVVEIMTRRITWPTLVPMATMKKPFQARESPKLAALSGMLSDRASNPSAMRVHYTQKNRCVEQHARGGIATIAGGDVFLARLVLVLRIFRVLGFFVHRRAATTPILTPVFRPPISVRKVPSSRTLATLDHNTSSNTELTEEEKKIKIGRLPQHFYISDCS